MADDDEEFEDDEMIDDDYESASDEEEEGDTLSAVMSPSRLLAVRRAIEARMEQKQMAASLDYLEIDFEDEE